MLWLRSQRRSVSHIVRTQQGKQHGKPVWGGHAPTARGSGSISAPRTSSLGDLTRSEASSLHSALVHATRIASYCHALKREAESEGPCALGQSRCVPAKKVSAFETILLSGSSVLTATSLSLLASRSITEQHRCGVPRLRYTGRTCSSCQGCLE